MIELIEGRPEGTLEVRFSGKLESSDYEKVLSPALEKALTENKRVKLLAHMGKDFEGFTAGAMWSDASLGVHHWGGFERVAIVTDHDWIENSIKIFGFALPCPVQVFDDDELDEARLWLSESLGSIHLEDMGNGVVHAHLMGKLEASAYDGVGNDLDGLIAKSDTFRLLIDLREFDGWQGLSALGHHLSLAWSHMHAPARVAIVGNEGWQRMAEKVMSRVLNAETRYFPEKDFDAAADWVKT